MTTTTVRLIIKLFSLDHVRKILLYSPYITLSYDRCLKIRFTALVSSSNRRKTKLAYIFPTLHFNFILSKKKYE